MNDAQYETITDMAGLLEFTNADAENLTALKPVFEKHGARITNGFYDSLQSYPKTAVILGDRVEKLKITHGKWLMSLFTGTYDRDFYGYQYLIGQVHVTQNINPEYVESVTSLIRGYGRIAINEELGRNDDSDAKYASLGKILDLCLLTINLSYADERIARMSKVTGMSRKLIENLIKRGK